MEQGGGGGGDGDGGVGNRWPREETLALLKIRSEMDVAFRDATVKGPLWEHVSRKLGELGYSRSGKKCKEKFENVQKYYKRTKDGRGGRQDGRAYKFFSQLEALHSSSTTLDVSPVSVALPNPTTTPAGLAFSSSSSSSSSSSDEDDDLAAGTTTRKRKRRSSQSLDAMMSFFESLMKRVLQKQETMQQSFLEALEKREQDRILREEAWKRQEMASFSRDLDLISDDRLVSASRHAAIVSFLQKITGQTIQFPPSLSTPSPPPTITTVIPPGPHPTPSTPPTQQQPQVSILPSNVVMAVPEQQVAPSLQVSGGVEVSSSFSRWPKAEVLALIKLRSGLESKYQEAVPKAPLWDEISAGMLRMGYHRSAKRCKEKWENINKYFKKVKETNKIRPQDSKTCPYFHELEALCRSKLVGSSSGDATPVITTTTKQDEPQQPESKGCLDAKAHVQPALSQRSAADIAHVQPANVNFPASPFEEANEGSKPEYTVKELMEQQGMQGQGEENSTTIEETDSDMKIGEEEEDDEEYEDEDEGDEQEEEDRKMAYKVEFQRQNAGTSNAGGNAAPFLAMVQ